MQSSWFEKVSTILNKRVRFSEPLTENNFESAVDKFSFQHYRDLLPLIIPLKYSCLETLAIDFETTGQKILSYLKDGSCDEQREILAQYFKFGEPAQTEFEPDVVYLVSCSPSDASTIEGLSKEYPDSNVLFVLFFLPGQEWSQLPELIKKRGPVQFRTETCSNSMKKARDFRMAFRAGQMSEEFPDASFFLCSSIASMKEICVLMKEMGNKCQLLSSCSLIENHFNFQVLGRGLGEMHLDPVPFPQIRIDNRLVELTPVSTEESEIFSQLEAIIDTLFDGYSAVLQPNGIPLALLGQKFPLPPSLKKRYGGFQRFIASSEVKARLSIELETDHSGVTFFHKKFGPEERSFCSYCLKHSFFSKHPTSSPDCLSHLINQIQRSLAAHSEKEMPLSMVVAGITFPDSVKKCFKNWSVLIDCPSIQKELRIQLVRDHVANNFKVLKK